MNDPYSVLGVDPSASDEEIKRVYRELARKYHPDNYQNNPLADLAEEKMKEVNAAYDASSASAAVGHPAAMPRDTGLPIRGRGATSRAGIGSRPRTPRRSPRFCTRCAGPS